VIPGPVDKPEHRVLPDQPASRVLLALQDRVGMPEVRVLPELLDSTAQGVLLDIRERKENRVLRVKEVDMELPA